MICDDCKKATDATADLGVTAVVVGQRIDAIVLDDQTSKMLNYILSGHERCRKAAALSTVNLQLETGSGSIRSYGCTCQHRSGSIPLTSQ